MNLVKTQQLLHKNSQTIFSSLAVTGLSLSIYLTIKASFAAKEELDEYNADMRFKDKVKIVWKNYIPAGITAASTISFIVMAQNKSNKKILAAQTAFAVTERAFQEYKHEIIEHLGETKESQISDKLAQNKVNNSPPKDIIITGSGEVLCCEAYTGRYFLSDIELLRKSENVINNKINIHDSATLSDFYYLLKIPDTSMSSDIGWDSTKLLTLEFSTALAQDGKPCLVFSYNYIKTI